MINKKYLRQIKKIIADFDENNRFKFFIFGSCLKKNHFGDIDLGILGNIKKKEIANLKENFESSNIPYFIDVINFKKTSKKFQNHILKNKILWLKQ